MDGKWRAGRPLAYDPYGDRRYREAGDGGHREEREAFGHERSGWTEEPLTAEEVMIPDVRMVGPEAPLKEIARVMKKDHIGVVPVVDREQRLMGMLTDRDIIVRGCFQDRPVAEVKAADIMTTDPWAVRPGTSVRDVLELMGQKQVRRVPVVDEQSRVIGIVSLDDIATRADFDGDLQRALHRISSRRSFWSQAWR